MGSKKSVFIFAISVAILGSILGILASNNSFPGQINRIEDDLTEIKDLEKKTADNQSRRTELSQKSEITFPEALEIAEKVIEGKAYHLERETEDGKPVIEVGIDGKEIFVDAKTGEIHSIDNLLEKGDSEDIEEITEALKLQKLAIISIQEAVQVAESFVEGKAHTVELENEDGNLVYEVAIDMQKIYVDAGNGKVLYKETIKKVNQVGNSQLNSSIQIPSTEDNN